MNEQYQAGRARMSEEYQQALQKKTDEIRKVYSITHNFDWYGRVKFLVYIANLHSNPQSVDVSLFCKSVAIV